VNFFGHAAVASWFDSHPGFVLGAMLPDFLSMLGGVRARVFAREVEAGVRLHHATDAAFHAIPAFVDQVASARSELARAGLARGAARAAAHIGVELLLDEVLAADRLGRHAYFSALEHARTETIELAWTGNDGQRFAELVSILAERGQPEFPSDPARLARRLRLALEGRPRLAFPPEQEIVLSDWVVRARPAVVGCAQVIVTELRSSLQSAGFAAAALADAPSA
jgi:acyl carrier protein phosphodiesterase